MKKAILTAALTCTLNITQAQWLHPCGTPEAGPELRHWQKQWRTHRQLHTSLRTAPDTIFIPAALHILCMSDSSGCFPAKELLERLCELNSDLADPATPSLRQIYFWIAPADNWPTPINKIYNTSAYNGNAIASENAVQSARVPNRANIFMMGSNEYCGVPGVCGCFTCCGDDEVTVANNCALDGSTTLQHEMGHWLGLPHTFDSWTCVECVDRNNCTTCGDGFCDTPADYLDYRWNCPYRGNDKEPSTCPPPQDVINPDGTLFMSYADDACQSRFSVEQFDYAWYLLNNNPNRAFWRSIPAPPRLPISDTPVNASPANGETNINPLYVTLSWDAVPNASWYVVTIRKGFSFWRDFITPSNKLILRDLSPSSVYRWSVKPFNATSFCTGTSQETSFTTAGFSVSVQVVDACGSDGKVEFVLRGQGGTFPYSHYVVETGQIFNDGDTISLPPAPYTIYTYGNSGSGAISVTHIELGGPSVAINLIADTVAQVLVSGGEPPYSYLWVLPDGSTISGKQQVTFSGYGTLSVVVTDGQGCQATRSVSVQPTGIELSAEVQHNVSIQARGAVVIVRNFSSMDVRVKVLDIAGKVILTQQVRGRSLGELSLAKLPAGVYFITAEEASGKIVETARVALSD